MSHRHHRHTIPILNKRRTLLPDVPSTSVKLRLLLLLLKRWSTACSVSVVVTGFAERNTATSNIAGNPGTCVRRPCTVAYNTIILK